jgi:hypothetical protein
MGKQSSNRRRLSEEENKFPVINPSLKTGATYLAATSGGNAGGRAQRGVTLRNPSGLRPGIPPMPPTQGPLPTVVRQPFLARRGTNLRQAQEIRTYQDLFQRAFGSTFSNAELRNQLIRDGAINSDGQIEDASSTTIRASLDNLYDRYSDLSNSVEPRTAPSTSHDASDPTTPEDAPSVPDDEKQSTTPPAPRRRSGLGSMRSGSANLFYGYNYGGYYDAPRRY